MDGFVDAVGVLVGDPDAGGDTDADGPKGTNDVDDVGAADADDEV